MADTQLPGVHNLVMYRGDDFARSFRFRVGTVVENLTGTTWSAQVRESPNADVVAATFMVTVVPYVDPETDLEDGTALLVELAGAVTAVLPAVGVWDLQQLTPVRRTRLKGSVKVDPDVTR